MWRLGDWTVCKGDCEQAHAVAETMQCDSATTEGSAWDGGMGGQDGAHWRLWVWSD